MPLARTPAEPHICRSIGGGRLRAQSEPATWRTCIVPKRRADTRSYDPLVNNTPGADGHRGRPTRCCRVRVPFGESMRRCYYLVFGRQSGPSPPAVCPHRPEAQDVALSRPKRGFESRWGRHQMYEPNPRAHCGCRPRGISAPALAARHHRRTFTLAHAEAPRQHDRPVGNR
jgi:hypothetical protein